MLFYLRLLLPERQNWHTSPVLFHCCWVCGLFICLLDCFWGKRWHHLTLKSICWSSSRRSPCGLGLTMCTTTLGPLSPAKEESMCLDTASEPFTERLQRLEEREPWPESLGPGEQCWYFPGVFPFIWLRLWTMKTGNLEGTASAHRMSPRHTN